MSHLVLWVISQTSEGREAPAEECKTSDERLMGTRKVVCLRCLFGSCQIICALFLLLFSFYIFGCCGKRKKVADHPILAASGYYLQEPSSLVRGQSCGFERK